MVVLEAFENYVWVMGNRRGRNESLSDKGGDRAGELSWAMKSVLGWVGESGSRGPGRRIFHGHTSKYSWGSSPWTVPHSCTAPSLRVGSGR